MNLIKKLFYKKDNASVTAPSSWHEIVESMYNKHLDAFADEVVQVIYSADRAMRYVIMINEKGLYSYQLEAIHQFNEKDDEWQYICSDDGSLHAMWEVPEGCLNNSFFNDKDSLMNALSSEHWYKQYFS